MIHSDRILREIVVSEKATEMSVLNKYTFKVAPDANRIAVAAAVEDHFEVTVTSVHIMNVKPRAKRDRMRRGRVGRKPGYKKAIVTLQEGDTIDVL